MAATLILPNSIKKKLLQAYLSGKTIKCALFLPAAAFSAVTTTYSTTNELHTAAGVVGYTAGGVTLTGLVYSADGVTPAWADWDNAVWPNATFPTGSAPRYAMFYDASTNDVILISDFGAEQTCNTSTFTATIPETGTGAMRLGAGTPT